LSNEKALVVYKCWLLLLTRHTFTQN
jgi:hypothetical protein